MGTTQVSQTGTALSGIYPAGMTQDDDDFGAALSGSGTADDGAAGTETTSPATTSSGASSSATASTAATSGNDSAAQYAFLDSSSYSSPAALAKWAPLVQGLPADQQVAAEKALNRPIAAAEMAAKGGADGAKALAYIDANPALKTAIDTAAHGGKADGTLSKHDFEAFVSNTQKQLGRADNTVAQYIKNNPNADGQSLQLVRQVALLQANMMIARAADPADAAGAAGQGKVSGDVTQAGLQALASANPGLGSALTSAANTWSSAGMFRVLDQGGKTGTDLATHNPDGKFDEGNIIDWVKKQAPASGAGFASLVNTAATENAVAGVDTSALGADVFANPQNYTAAQKAAVLVQLQQTEQQVEAGSSLKKTDKTMSELETDISQLQNDPDVQSYLSAQVPAGEQSIVESDPSLLSAVNTRYDTQLTTGAALQDGIDQVQANNADSKKTKETDAQAVGDFSTEMSFEQDLRGAGNTPSVNSIIDSSPSLNGELQSAYIADESQGGELSSLLSTKGETMQSALQQTSSDQQVYASALDGSFIASQQDATLSSTTSVLQTQLMKNGSGKDVLSGLGVDKNTDTASVAATIAATDPSQLYSSNETPLSTADAQSLVKSFLDDLKTGDTPAEAIAKFTPGSGSFDAAAGSPALMQALQTDPAMAQSAATLLGNVAYGGLMMHQDAAANTSSGAALSGTAEASEAVGVGAMLTQGASAIADGSVTTGAATATGTTGKTAGVLDAAGKGLDGVAGTLGAVFDFASIGALLRQGQKGAAGVTIVDGAQGSLSAADSALGAVRGLTGAGIGTLGETAGSAAGDAVGAIAGEAAGEAAGVAVGSVVEAAAGPVGAIVGGIAMAILAIVEAVKKDHEKKAFSNTVDPTLKQYGIDTPS